MIKLPEDPRMWFYYPIIMPVNKQGFGPVDNTKEPSIVMFEVWDQFANNYRTFDNLPDAISLAIKMNVEKCVSHKSGFLYDPELCEIT